MKRYRIVLSVVFVVSAIAAYNYFGTNRTAGNNSASQHDESNASVATPQPAASPAATPAQPAAPDHFDTSLLKPPAGAKVAVYEFEDLECPACAHAFPIVRAAVDRYRIPLVRRDYPWSFHPWSFEAAVTARYLQDRVSPRLAEDFRGAVFANQTRIASKDDLTAFTRTWFQSHNQGLPFVMDPSGACRLEVESDHDLGDRIGVAAHGGTPCIFVVTQTSCVHVADPSQLDRTIQAALAQTAAAQAIPSESQPLTIAPSLALQRLALQRLAPARA